MANEHERPPLGCRPCYIPASERIKELADAISRASIDPDGNKVRIVKWAGEIISQCNIVYEFK